MSDILDQSLCYLIGPIEGDNNYGVGWRSRLIKSCKDAELKIIFLDPTNKVTGLQQEIGKEHNELKVLREEAEYDILREKMKQIVREDHRSVDISDFVIVYVNPSVHTCGSYFEVQSALSQKKPYYFIIEGGKTKAPLWLFGIVDHNYMFASIDEVVTELKKVNSGQTKLSNRWVLVRKQLKELC